MRGAIARQAERRRRGGGGGSRGGRRGGERRRGGRDGPGLSSQPGRGSDAGTNWVSGAGDEEA